MPGDRYSPAEDVIIFFFFSRGAIPELIREILKLKTQTDRSEKGIQQRVRTVRQNLLDDHGRDPYESKQWDTDMIDAWLTRSTTAGGRGVQRNRVLDLIRIDNATNDLIDKWQTIEDLQGAKMDFNG